MNILGPLKKTKETKRLHRLDILVMSFDGEIYKPVEELFMRYQESKDETCLFMKVAANVMFTDMSEKYDIKKF